MISENCERFVLANAFEKAFTKMHSLYVSKSLCDVVLVVDCDALRISAHRNVLAASSEYFYGMFVGDMTERDAPEIALKDITGDGLKPLIDSCYTGWIDLDKENVYSVLAAASHLRFEEIEKKCAQYLKKHLTTSTCLEIHAVAERFSLTELSTAAMDHIAENFVTIATTEEFCQLSKGQLLQILKNSELDVNSEEDFVKAIISWVQNDQQNRTELLPDLVKLIRFGQLEKASMLRWICRISDLIGNHHVFRDILAISAMNSPPRMPQSQLIYAIGGDDDTARISIEVFCRRSNEWKNIDTIAGNCCRAAGVALGREIIITGGKDQQNNGLKSVFALDVQTFQMRKLKPMIENRSGHTAAVLNGNIYVIGGECGQSNWLNSVEKYDPEKDEWTKVASMSVARGFTGATVLGNHLYVVGGRDDVCWHNSIERYDPDADEWVLMTPMMERRAGHVVAAHQGSVYVFGGTNKKITSRSVERFDPGTNTWTQIAIVNESRRRASAISHAGKLIIFGGFDGKSEMQDVDEFDIATNSWTKLAPMRKKRGYFSIVKLK